MGPQTSCEQSYVDSLAQHLWLIQRCNNILNRCYQLDALWVQYAQQFALISRYQTANERGRDRCINQLLKLRAEKRNKQIGFESQKRHQACETRKVETHQARLNLTNAKIKQVEFASSQFSLPFR